MNLYKQPTIKQRKQILEYANESERYVKETERAKLTCISRVQAWQLEKESKFPKRVKLSSHSVAWLLSDILWFIYETSNVIELFEE